MSIKKIGQNKEIIKSLIKAWEELMTWACINEDMGEDYEVNYS